MAEIFLAFPSWSQESCWSSGHLDGRVIVAFPEALLNKSYTTLAIPVCKGSGKCNFSTKYN